MSRSINKVILVGRAGSDPEVRHTQSGTKVAKISLATTRSWTTQSGQDQEKTEWHRVTFWGRLADIVEQYVAKGDRIYVEGRIEYSQTEHDGVTRYWTDIQAQEILLLGGTNDRAPRAPAPTSAPSNPFEDDSDLPF